MSRSIRRTHAVSFVVLAVVLVALVPATTAAEPRAGGSVVVDADETTGDLEAFGGDVVVRGTVDGDLETFAGNVRILGEVTGDVETASGNVLIGGDVSAAGGNVHLVETGSIGGSLEAGAGTVTIDGEIGDSARIGASEIRLGPTASIGGDLEYDGDLSRADGAQIGGQVTENTDLSVGGPLPSIPGFLFSVYFFLVNLVVGAILLLAFPRFSRGLVDRTVDRPGVTGIAGVGVLAATPIVLVLVAITILGLPLDVVGFGIYILGLWLGAIYGRYLLGAWLLGLVDRENRWAALVLGLVLVFVATRIPVVGGLFDLAVLVFGLGALALGIASTYRGRGGRAAEAEEGHEPAVAAD